VQRAEVRNVVPEPAHHADVVVDVVPDQHDGAPARHVAAGHGGATEVARDDGGRLGERDELAVAELEAVRAPGDEVGIVEVRVLADTQVRGF